MRWFAIVALLCVTAVWGYTFVVVRDAVALYPVLPFLSLRFLLATLAFAPIIFRHRADIAAGILPGVALAVGYLCQTLGLQHTTASQAGLLTGLFVVITPVLEFVVYRSVPRRVTMWAVFAAFLGTALIALPNGIQLQSDTILGDALEIATAVAFSVHILVLSRAGKGRSATQITLGQILTATAVFTVGSAGARAYPVPSPSVWTALAITALGATAAAFWVQTYVQQRISPSRTALVLVLEPVFATFFGLVISGDRFSALQAVGAALILAALIVHEAVLALRPPRAKADENAPRRLAEGRHVD